MKFDIEKEFPITNFGEKALLFKGGDYPEAIESISIKINLKKQQCHVVLNTRTVKFETMDFSEPKEQE